MDKEDLIVVTGGTGLVGSGIVRKLKENGFKNIWYPSRSTGMDLSNDCCNFISSVKSKDVKYIFHAASLVGGIKRNIDFPADFGMVNSLINNTVIRAAYESDAKLLFLGSSCIYPRECDQPMKEEYLMTGKCEPTNEMYALSKIYGIKMCQAYRKQYGSNFITCQPSNIYGVGDHFDLENAHVVGAMINRFHEAKILDKSDVTLWGTGSAQRELLYVDDVADACVFLMENYNDDGLINVGTGEDVTIKQLAEMIREVVGFAGEIKWDDTKPDGMPKKLLEVSRIHEMGWQHKTSLKEGLIKTYNWYLENVV